MIKQIEIIMRVGHDGAWINRTEILMETEILKRNINEILEVKR
jgi:hypothetical protein